MQKVVICLEFIHDAGHGWLKVPHDMMLPPTKAKISPYSYRDEKFAYLEEDCDAERFVKDLPPYITLTTKNIEHRGDSPIRRKDRYRP